jgi:hypothetical protein
MHEYASLWLSQCGIEAIPRKFNETIKAFLLEGAQPNHVRHSVTTFLSNSCPMSAVSG